MRGSLRVHIHLQANRPLPNGSRSKLLGRSGGLEAPGIATLNRAGGRICVKKLAPDELSADVVFSRAVRVALKKARCRVLASQARSSIDPRSEGLIVMLFPRAATRSSTSSIKRVPQTPPGWQPRNGGFGHLESSTISFPPEWIVFAEKEHSILKRKAVSSHRLLQVKIMYLGIIFSRARRREPSLPLQRALCHE
jgi:hypothetical protein